MDKKSLKFFDYFLESERHKIDDILPFLKCNNCSEYMLDPKSCVQCGEQICEPCIKKKCNHPPTTSRHFKVFLDNLVFSCRYSKFGCKERVKFLDLRNHTNSCEFARNESSSNSKVEKKKSAVLTLNDFITKTDDESSKANISINLTCLNCKKTLSDREAFVGHLSQCYVKMDVDNPNEANEKLISEFKQNLEKYQESNFLYWKQINQEWIENLAIANIEFEENYRRKNDKINELVSTISSYLSNGMLQNDKEYMDLCENERHLIEKKNELQKIYEAKVKEYNDKQTTMEYQIQQKIEEYKKSLNEIDHQKLIICEELKRKGNNQIISDLTETSSTDCSKCGNNDEKMKKLFCQNCRKKFCEAKCVNICKGSVCNQNGVIVCPSCSVSCGLCRKYNYCDNCKRKCFYNLCNNRFCPECYKRNEHQARNQNINCKFFTCEIDNRCDCLMTSLFCNKCEKRMCSNCSSKHVNHFPFLADNK